MPTVTFELFGIARRRARAETAVVFASTLGEALRALEKKVPDLSPDVLSGGRLARSWHVSLEGRRFVEGDDTPLPPNARLLLLSSMAGG